MSSIFSLAAPLPRGKDWLSWNHSLGTTSTQWLSKNHPEAGVSGSDPILAAIVSCQKCEQISNDVFARPGCVFVILLIQIGAAGMCNWQDG